MSCAWLAGAAGGTNEAKVLGVLMLSTTMACEFGVIVAGENEQAVPAGRPEQEKETWLVKGWSTALTNNSYCPVWPAITAAALLRDTRAKSMTVTVVAA